MAAKVPQASVRIPLETARAFWVGRQVGHARSFGLDTDENVRKRALAIAAL